MNRGNRHLSYRKSVYRRRRIRVVLIVIGIVLAVLLALFLILGNLFFDKVQSNPEPPKKGDTPTDVATPFPFESVRHVKASLLSVNGSTSAVLSRLRALTEAGSTAVSLPLTDASGTLLYHSEQATVGNYAIRGSASLALSDLAEAAHASGTYLCGTYVLSAASEENPLTRSVLLAESAAVLAEAFLAGVDDIVIITPSLTAEQQTELLRLLETVRAFAPNAIVGLSLPEVEIAAPDATRIDSLARAFDYLALDLTAYGEEAPVTFAESRMSTMLYYLLRYEMRVLIPALEDEMTQTALISAVEKESVDNWMLVRP